MGYYLRHCFDQSTPFWLTSSDGNLVSRNRETFLVRWHFDLASLSHIPSSYTLSRYITESHRVHRQFWALTHSLLTWFKVGLHFPPEKFSYFYLCLKKHAQKKNQKFYDHVQNEYILRFVEKAWLFKSVDHF